MGAPTSACVLKELAPPSSPPGAVSVHLDIAPNIMTTMTFMTTMTTMTTNMNHHSNHFDIDIDQMTKHYALLNISTFHISVKE